MCPNKGTKEYQDLIAAYGEGRALASWVLNNEQIPTIEQAATLLGVQSPAAINNSLKIVNVLGTGKVQQLYNKFYKNNPEKFYNELIPLAGKEQVQILRDYNNRNSPISLQDMLTGIMSEMSYTVEVNTATKIGREYDDRGYHTQFDINGVTYEHSEGDYSIISNGVRTPITFEEFLKASEQHKNSGVKYNTQYYSNMNVPGGTNYTENEIATPGITPSIKGHAQFSTDNGIGWFRSDDKAEGGSTNKKEQVVMQDGVPVWTGKMVGITTGGTSTKTRRILELQSDLFQKGREHIGLIRGSGEEVKYWIDKIHDDQFIVWVSSEGQPAEPENEFTTREDAQKYIDDINSRKQAKVITNENKFLQLLNKDGNWIPFFIKTIVQDSAKKGYEKVLFPTGDTASKVEGHETIEEFKRQKEDRLAELEKKLKEGKYDTYVNVFGSTKENEIESEKDDIEREIKQIKEELKRVESEGFAALKPIYNFYENRVYRELEKMYSKEGVTRIKDEYGNEWYEVEVVSQVDKNPILFQLSTISGPSDERLNQSLKNFVTAIGGKIQNVKEIVIDGKVISAAAVVDIINRTIQVVDGKAGKDTLPEEVGHLFVAYMNEDSRFLQEMMKDIRMRDIYDNVLAEYGDNEYYKNPDGSVDEDKIAKEAIGKMIARAIVGQWENKKEQGVWERFWNKLWKLIQQVIGIYKDKESAYEKVASQILSGSTESLDMKKVLAAEANGQYYFQLSADEEKMVRDQLRTATDIQKQVAEDIYFEPHRRVTLDPATHTYSSADIQNPVIYKSVTTAIHGKWSDEQQQRWGFTADQGNEVHGILQDLVIGRTVRDTPLLARDIRGEIIGYLKRMINDLQADGSILLSEVIVHDDTSLIAGSIDLLAVDPFGNMKIIDLKTSKNPKSSRSYTKVYDRREDEGAGAVLKTPVSKATSHSVQVGTYSKLVNLMGYPVYSRRTEHLVIDSSDGIITSFEADGFIEHDPTDNLSLIDLIVPTKISKMNRLEELNATAGTENPISYTEDTPLSAEEQVKQEDALRSGIIDIIQTVQGWRDYLDRMKQGIADFIPQDDTIRKIDQLLFFMEQEFDSKNGYSAIYSKFLEAVSAHLTSINNYLSDPENVKKEGYGRTILMAKKYADMFQPLIYSKKFVTTDAQNNALIKVQGKLTDTNITILNATKENVKNLVSEFSANPVYKDSTPVTLPDGTLSTVGEQALLAAVSRDTDISQTTMLMDTIGNSGVPVLENLSKLLATTRDDVRASAQVIKDKTDEEGNLLGEATNWSKDRFDYLYQRDSEGKKTGRVVSQLGMNYMKELQRVNRPLYHIVNGEYAQKEYIKGNKLTEEQLQWNIDLAYLKRDKQEFMSPEKTSADYDTKTSYSEDGEYHEYTQEFKEKRDIYMEQDWRNNGEWKVKREWVNDPEYLQWRTENFDWVVWDGAVWRWNEDIEQLKPTGQVERKMRYFPKKKNSISREISASGVDLWDATYRKMMNPQTSLEKAQSRFYKHYVDTMRAQVEKLPAGAMDWLEKGYIPMVGANFLQQLANKDINTSSLIMSELRSFFEVTATNDNKIGEGGQSVPLMYMGTLQSQERVQEIQDTIAEHVKKKGDKTGQALKQWHEEYDKLLSLLKRESSKMTADQLHPDMVVALNAFIDMSENFHIMTGIEDQLQLTGEQLRKMEFEQSGGLFRKGKVVKGEDSKAYQLYKHVLDTIYYGERPPTTLSEVYVNKIMKLTSAISLPLNIFGMINNKFMARVNNRIDSWGDDFFKQSAYNRMIGLYNTEHIPGWLRTTAGSFGDKTYGGKRIGSKYEAATKMFDMVRRLNTGQGRVEILGDIGYAGYEAGEWEVQSLVGNAILGSVQMRYTGNNPQLQDCSLYDALSWDENTQTLKLIDGYVYLNPDGTIAENQKRAQQLVINRIHETNDRIHGNYDPANRVMLERNAAGKLIMQFHKWVYPAFKQRYRKGKFDENLGGGMDIEGRYLTLWNWIKAMKKLGVSTDRWSELTDHQRSNLKKDLADALYIAALFALVHLIRAATDDLPDDDTTTKRLRNWLTWQGTRGLQEVSIWVPGVGLVESFQLVQNPFAATSTLRDFAMIIKDAAKYPFQEEEDRYIQRGNFKGELRLYNDLQRAFPLARELRTWQNMKTVNTFYIQ